MTPSHGHSRPKKGPPYRSLGPRNPTKHRAECFLMFGKKSDMRRQNSSMAVSGGDQTTLRSAVLYFEDGKRVPRRHQTIRCHIYTSMMLEPHAAVGTVTASLSCTHHHADSCTSVLVRTGIYYGLYPDSISSLFSF